MKVILMKLPYNGENNYAPQVVYTRHLILPSNLQDQEWGTSKVTGQRDPTDTPGLGGMTGSLQCYWYPSWPGGKTLLLKILTIYLCHRTWRHCVGAQAAASLLLTNSIVLEGGESSHQDHQGQTQGPTQTRCPSAVGHNHYGSHQLLYLKNWI